jgi:hypothetical protein
VLDPELPADPQRRPPPVDDAARADRRAGRRLVIHQQMLGVRVVLVGDVTVLVEPVAQMIRRLMLD